MIFLRKNIFRSATLRAAYVRIKLAVYKPRSLNVKVLRVTILPGQRADSPPQLVIPPLIHGSVTSSLSLLISQQVKVRDP